MKIAGIIFESLRKAGGYEIFTYNLHKRLALRGHDVTLYLPAREVARHRNFYNGLPFHIRPLIPKTFFFLKHGLGMLQRHLAWEQAKYRYDAWQVMGAWPEGGAVLKVNAPKLMRNYGEDIQVASELEYGIRRDPVMDAKVRHILCSMDRVVGMTDSMATLQQELGVAPKNIVRIPNGIDTTRFARDVNTAAIRTRHGLPQDVPLLLTVGRNHPKKGFDLIPAIAEKLQATGQPFIWLVVGGDTDKLSPEIQARGLDGVVRPMPPISCGPGPVTAELDLPVDALLDVYAMCDLFVFPSRLEGFSRVLIEAMGAGLPVITTDAPGCGETFTHGKEGFVSKVDDTNSLAANTARLLSNPERKARFSAQARTTAQAFDWDNIAQAYEQVYRELAEQ